MKYWIGDRQGYYETPYGGSYWVFRSENNLTAGFVVELTGRKYHGLVKLVKNKKWDRVAGFLKSNHAAVHAGHIDVDDKFGTTTRFLTVEKFVKLAVTRWPDFEVMDFIE